MGDGEMDVVDQQKIRKTLNMWTAKTPTKESFVIEANKSLDHVKLLKELSNLRIYCDQLQSRVGVLEAKHERLDRNFGEMHDKIGNMEQEIIHIHSEESIRQRQIELLSSNGDAERGTIADQKAQIEYLTKQVSDWRTQQQLTPTQATYWAVISWVYIPLLHLVKGIWVMLFPIVATFQRLTLFNPKFHGGGGLGGTSLHHGGMVFSKMKHHQRVPSDGNLSTQLQRDESLASSFVGDDGSPAAGERLSLLELLKSGKLDFDQEGVKK